MLLSAHLPHALVPPPTLFILATPTLSIPVGSSPMPSSHHGQELAVVSAGAPGVEGVDDFHALDARVNLEDFRTKSRVFSVVVGIPVGAYGLWTVRDDCQGLHGRQGGLHSQQMLLCEPGVG